MMESMQTCIRFSRVDKNVVIMLDYMESIQISQPRITGNKHLFATVGAEFVQT